MPRPTTIHVREMARVLENLNPDERHKVLILLGDETIRRLMIWYDLIKPSQITTAQTKQLLIQPIISALAGKDAAESIALEQAFKKMGR